jgi:hypothetical protein
MTDPTLALTTILHFVYNTLRIPEPTDRELHDRGAVSIEQVLWYAAAAVSVAVVAAIIWSQIKTTASTGVNTPSAP